MTGTWSKWTRLLVAAFLVVPAFVVSAAVTSTAAPTQQQVEAAKQRLAQLQTQFEASVEAWNNAKYQLEQVQAKLAGAKATRDAAERDAARARDALAKRAVDAYTGMGSDLDILLGAQSFGEFSDQLEYMGQIAQSDSDLAAKADAAGQRADWAAQQYAQAVQEAQSHLNDMTAVREQIQANLAEQQRLAADLSQQWQAAIAAQQAAAAAAAAQEQNALTNPAPGPPPSSGGFVPPPNASAAEIAVAAAKSVIGAPYVFGAAGPSSFDCSGLTMWAWAQAGVSLPHSASAQLGTLPHVPLSSVAPGDIIYYGSVSPHVAIYIGGGQIIHARHPGPGGQVQYDSMYGYDTPWAAMRPGV
jgi:cell wall-associated NlpC family hydrolase